MEITKTLQPGDMGSKELFAKYGDRLICVRYRIDHNLKRRYKTVELIVEDKPYVSNRRQTMVWLRIGFDEAALREQVKKAGGKWLVDHKVWEMDYDVAKNLKLTKRMVKRFQNENGQM